MPKPIPLADVPISERNGLCTQDWFDFFRELVRLLDALEPPIPPEPEPTPVPVPVLLTYGPVINTDVALARDFILTVTNSNNFTMVAPTNPVPGRQINYTFRNASGGGVGTVTWDAVFKLPNVPANWSPPNGFNRSINFFYDGNYWVQRYSSEFDVPN